MSLLKNFADTLSALMSKKVELDLTQFNNPIATQIDWNPLKRGGSSFRTHKLLLTDPNRIEVVATKGAVIFAMVFLVIGLGALISQVVWIFVFSNFERLMDFEAFTVILLLIGTVFTSLGIIIYRSTTKKKTFDLQNGFYWEGKQDPREIFDLNRNECYIPLQKIHALQLIRERVSTDKSYFFSYELNLVLTDLTRHNVMDHGNLPKLREDAQQIANFLKVPIWDVIDQ